MEIFSYVHTLCHFVNLVMIIIRSCFPFHLQMFFVNRELPVLLDPKVLVVVLDLL